MTEDNDIDLTLLHTPYTSQDYHDYEKRVLRNYLLTQAAFLKKATFADFRKFQHFWENDTERPLNNEIEMFLNSSRYSFLRYNAEKFKKVVEELKSRKIILPVGRSLYSLGANFYSEFVKNFGICVINSVNDALRFDQVLKLSLHQWLQQAQRERDIAPCPDTAMENSYCDYYYRGQANYQWELVPNIFRYAEQIPRSLGLNFVEKAMFERFRRQLHLYNVETQNTFDAYAIAQHHGLPTRLLDWSKNILKALFFACYNESELESPGKLFCFSPRLHLMNQFNLAVNILKVVPVTSWFKSFAPNYAYPDGQAIQEIVENLLERKIIKKQLLWEHIEGPIPVIPFRTDPRMQAQEGVFTLFTNQTGFNENKTIVFRAIIPAEHKKEIIRDLNSLGINYQSMFPDLDHFAQHLKVRAGLTKFVSNFQIE